MSRYEGFTEPLEVLVEILREQRKQTELLERLVMKKAEIPENTRSTTRGKRNTT